MITRLMQEIKERLEIIDKYLQEKDYLKVYENSLKYAKEKMDSQDDYINELQQRIDKAIEYIEKKEEKQIAYNFDYWLDDDEIIELLDILKGSDSNVKD